MGVDEQNKMVVTVCDHVDIHMVPLVSPAWVWWVQTDVIIHPSLLHCKQEVRAKPVISGLRTIRPKTIKSPVGV